MEETNNDRQFLPRFSIQQLMLVMVGFAIISMILGWSIRGSVFAYSIGLSLIGLVIPFAIYVVIFALSQFFVTYHRARQPVGQGVPMPPAVQNSGQQISAESNSIDVEANSQHDIDANPAANQIVEADSVQANPTVEGDPS